MQRQYLFLKFLSDASMRFFIITTFAVMWYGLAIPVEAGISEEDIIREIAGAENCLKAMDEVKDHYDDIEKVKAFIKLCEEFIDDINLTEQQIDLLKDVGYDRDSKKFKETDADQKAKGKKGNVTDSSASDKKDQGKGKDKKPPSEKKSKDKESAQKKDDAAKPSGDTKPQKETPKKDSKEKISEKPATKPDTKDEPKEAQTQFKDEKTSETKTEAKSEPAQADSKPVIQEKSQENVLPIIDFSKIDIPALTPEELGQAYEELKNLARTLKSSPQPGLHAQAGFQDPNVAGAQFGFGAQFAHQFGQGEPQFQHHEFRAQFPDPGLGAGIPQGAAFPDPLFQQGFPQGAAIPNPAFQQGVPPFPQQQQFGAQFEAQFGPQFGAQFDHQQFVQVPPVPQWGADLPNQGIPQPEGNVVGESSQTSEQQQAAQASSEAKPKDESSTKRKVDEL